MDLSNHLRRSGASEGGEGMSFDDSDGGGYKGTTEDGRYLERRHLLSRLTSADMVEAVVQEMASLGVNSPTIAKHVLRLIAERMGGGE